MEIGIAQALFLIFTFLGLYPHATKDGQYIIDPNVDEEVSPLLLFVTCWLVTIPDILLWWWGGTFDTWNLWDTLLFSWMGLYYLFVSIKGVDKFNFYRSLLFAAGTFFLLLKSGFFG